MSQISTSDKALINVAVGIVQDAAGRYLVALRAMNQDQGNLWEFPGGKVEPGEGIYEALCRELREEIGIQVLAATALLQTHYDYAEYPVLLHVWQVDAYQGEPCGMEGQPLDWVSLAQLQQMRFPAANESIIEFLNSKKNTFPVQPPPIA